MTGLAVWGAVLAVGGLVALGPGMTLAADNSPFPSSTAKSAPKVDSNYLTAEKFVKVERYQDAIPLLQKVVAADPKNADALNYLGYSHRKLGKLDDALKHYQMALAIDPEHRGANEYLGELYLEMGQLTEAEKRLAKLDDICFFGCDEFTELKKAIESYKKNNSG